MWQKSPNLSLHNASFGIFIACMVPEIFAFLGTDTPVEICIPLVGWLKIFRKVECGKWKVTFFGWLGFGKWKVTFGNWKVECDFWKVKNIFWYHMFVCAVHYSMTRVITLWSPTRAPILSKNLNFLFKPAQIFPQYYDIVVISSKNWKIHWKIHLKKKT